MLQKYAQNQTHGLSSIKRLPVLVVHALTCATVHTSFVAASGGGMGLFAGPLEPPELAYHSVRHVPL